MRVYQFRDADIARRIAADRRLKISTFPEMNDPFELAGVGFKASQFKIVPPPFRAHVEQLFHNSVLPALKKKVGAVCFSRGWQNPVLWAHYADKHKGIALGFDIEESNTIELRPTRYVPAKEVHEIGPLLDEGFGSSIDERPMEMDQFIPLFQEILGIKFKDWAYEEEVRVFAELKEEIDGMFFVDFDDRIVLSEVILGIRCPIDIAEISRDLAGYKNEIKIIKAAASETRFEVLEDVSKTVFHDPS